MNDNTLLIVALGVGAFLLTRPAGARPISYGATAAQRQFAATNRGPAVAPDLYRKAGGLIGGLLSKYGGGKEPALTNMEYTAIGTRPESIAEGIAYTGNGNVFDQAAASIGKNPFGLYSTDSMATNPAPGFSSAYDYSKEAWF